MNASVVSEAVQAASTVSTPIVTPIMSLVSPAVPATSMVETAASNASVTATSGTAAASSTSNVAAASTEKLILGISQRNLIIGGAVIGTAAIATGGILWYRHKSKVPTAGIEILMDPQSKLPRGLSFGAHDGRKLDRADKKLAKEMLAPMHGLTNEQVTADLIKIASSENPSFMGISLMKFPGTNLELATVEDRVALASALVNQAGFRVNGYPTVLEINTMGDRPVIRIIPIVNGKEIDAVKQLDLMAKGDEKK